MSLIKRYLTGPTILAGLSIALPAAVLAKGVALPPMPLPPVIVAGPTAMPSTPAPIDLLNTMIGVWDGQLEYLDYGANRWFGIPARTTISSGGDGVTFLRVTDFDDGPEKGIVRITTVSILGGDGVTEYTTAFRKGRVPEMATATLRVERFTDATHWVLISEGSGMDADRPAILRLTTTRDGNSIVTMKQVDFTDDDKAEWLDRNRTSLTAMRYNG